MKKVIATISLILILFYRFAVGTSSYFGSFTDWVNQHTVFPDYFRNTFYHTHTLFPDFAPQIGCGQNIYYFSYYGLYSPWLFLSYLFPFISMITFIQFINLFIILLDGILFYYWISTKYPKTTSYLITLLFVLSAPILFQAHRQFMFVNYMPFLLMSLIAMDSYFAKKQPSGFVLSTFLAITTSYYYAAGILLTQFLYFIFTMIQNGANRKEARKHFFRLLGYWSISVLMSMALLLPTAYVITHGRTPRESAGIGELLVPVHNLNALLYDPYALGYGFIGVVALVFCLFSRKRQFQILSLAILLLLTIPLFSYLLNGTLYAADKGLIPVSPLIALLILEFADACENHRFTNTQWIAGASLSAIALVLCSVPLDLIFFLELAFILIGVDSLYRGRRNFALIPWLVFAIVHTLTMNRNEVYVNKKEYAQHNALPNRVDDLNYRSADLRNDTHDTINRVFYDSFKIASVYSSITNPDYSLFSASIFNNVPFRNELIHAQTKNVLLQSLLGVKHIFTDDPSPLYSKEKDSLYANRLALPIGYASGDLLSKETFAKLDDFERLEALLTAIVVNDGPETAFYSSLQPVPFEFPPIGTNRSPTLRVIDVDKETTTKIATTAFRGKILLLKFDVLNDSSCRDGDLSITIDGSRNTKTCKDWAYKNNNNTFRYVINTDQDFVDMTISSGHYEIDHVETRLLNEEDMVRIHYDPFVITKYENNLIEGIVNVSRDGYFALSIPYDNGFTVKMDGKSRVYSKVNESFIGWKINRGRHDIRIEFRAPWKKPGLALSVFGFALFFLLALRRPFRKDSPQSHKEH